MKKIFAIILVLSLLSFSSEEQPIEFNYPKKKNATITMATGAFKKFKKEWRGEDYYYLCENSENGIICSVLFYKLNENEQKRMVDPFDPEGKSTSPMIPFTYFLNSNLKKYEQNNATWGAATEDFMFRQNDILDFEGVKMKQKHMYAYCMIERDLFVNIHLSKINYTAKDSIEMRTILGSLKKNK